MPPEPIDQENIQALRGLHFVLKIVCTHNRLAAISILVQHQNAIVQFDPSSVNDFQ